MSHQSSPLEQLLGMMFTLVLIIGAGLLLLLRTAAHRLTDDRDNQEPASHDDRH